MQETKTTLLSQIKERLLEELHEFHSIGGVGKDYYCDDAMPHAMAEGRFLSIVGTLYDSGVLSGTVATSYAEQSISRLESLSIGSSDYRAWGLGFEWNGTPSNEPFVITTTLVVDGLDSVATLELPGVAAMAESGRGWLLAAPNNFGKELGGEFKVPYFSPNIQSTPWNVIASWARTLFNDPNNSETMTYETILRWVASKRSGGIGWTYDESSHRIDLLHQFYILDSISVVLSPEENEQLTIDTLSIFQTVLGFSDKLDLLPVEEAEMYLAKNKIQVIPIHPSHCLIAYPAPARDWSIGDALYVCSKRLSEHPNTVKPLYPYAVLLCKEILNRFDNNTVLQYPRHIMHLCLGMSSYLCATRLMKVKKTNE